MDCRIVDQLRTRRLRSTRGTRRLRPTRSTRCRGSPVKPLRLQGNLRRRCGRARLDRVFRSFPGCGKIRSALLACRIGRLIECAALQTLHDIHGGCWSVTHLVLHSGPADPLGTRSGRAITMVNGAAPGYLSNTAPTSESTYFSGTSGTYTQERGVSLANSANSSTVPYFMQAAWQ